MGKFTPVEMGKCDPVLTAVRLGLVEACNPFVDGCVSISRAARRELPNHMFCVLMLPAGGLQEWCWVPCSAWLRALGVAPTRKLRALRGST